MWNTKVKNLSEGTLSILLHLEPVESKDSWVVFKGEPSDLARRVSGVLGFKKSDKSALLKVLAEAKDADTKDVFTWKDPE